MSHSQPNPRSHPQQNPQSWATKITLLLASSLTVMAGATVSPALPVMKQHFESAIADVDTRTVLVKLIITLPALFIVIGSPIAGLIVYRFGRKPLLLITTLLYGLAGSSGLYFDSLTAILAGRAVLGFAVAGVMVTATTLIADYYSGPARAAFMGLQAGFMGLGGVVFLTFGGILAQQNWRYPFGIYLFAWLIVPLILAFILEPNRSDASLRGVESPTPDPPPQLMPVGVLGIVYGLTTLSQIAFYMIPVQLPFFLETLVQAVPSQSGMAIAVCTMFSAIASLTYGKLKQRMEFVTFLPLIFGLMGIGYLLIGQSANWAQVLTGLAISGMGLGILMPNMTVWLSVAVPEAMRGRALGGLSTALFLGQFLSPIALKLNHSISLQIFVFDLYRYIAIYRIVEKVDFRLEIDQLFITKNNAERWISAEDNTIAIAIKMVLIPSRGSGLGKSSVTKYSHKNPVSDYPCVNPVLKNHSHKKEVDRDLLPLYQSILGS